MKPGRHPNSGKLIACAEKQLPDAEEQHIREHLAQCLKCRAQMDVLSHSAELLKRLPILPLPDSAEKRIRAAMSDAANDTDINRPRLLNRRTAIAAALILACGSLLLFYQKQKGGIELHIPKSSASLLEQTAARLYEEQISNRVVFDYTGTSPQQARSWIQQNAGVEADIATVRPPEDGKRFRLQGVKEVHIAGVSALFVAYQVDNHPVTLLTAKASNLQNAPPRSYVTKRVFYRENGSIKSLSWNSAGQVYSLVSDLPQFGHESCYICHTGRSFRDRIDRMHLEK